MRIVLNVTDILTHAGFIHWEIISAKHSDFNEPTIVSFVGMYKPYLVK